MDTLTKEARIYNEEKIVSSVTGAEKKCTAMCKRMKLEHSLTPYRKIKSRCIKELNVRPDNIELLGEKK